MRELTRLSFKTPDKEAGRQPQAIKPTRFSLRDAPERERDDLYREFFGRSVMRYDVEPSRDIPLDIDVRLQMLPGLLMVTGKMHGSVNRRTQQRMVDGLDDFAMAINLGGRYVVRQGQQEIVLEDGEATLFSMGNLCNLMHWPPGDFVALRFPRSQIMPRIAAADEVCMRPIRAGTQALKLLTSYVNVAQESETVADLALQHAFSNHIYDLVALAAGATRDAVEEAQGRGLRAARLHAIKRGIAENLDRPDLSVAAIAREHGCTPRFVQRLFETEGTTLTEYVLAQRLARAHRLLSDPRLGGEKISTVAYDAGFGDLSYFYRAFRRRYGASPSDVREQTRRGS
jgi:AraC-like DNA-binding protein